MLSDDDKTQGRSNGPDDQPTAWTPADAPLGSWATSDANTAPDQAIEAPADTQAPAQQNPFGTPPPFPTPAPLSEPTPTWQQPVGWPPSQNLGPTPGPAAPSTAPQGPTWPGQAPQGGWQNQGWPPVQPQPNWQPVNLQNQGWPPAQQQAGWPPAPPQQNQGWPPPAQPPAWTPMPSPWQSPTPTPSSSRRPSRLPAILAVVAACMISFSSGMVFDHFVFGTGQNVTANQPTSGSGTTSVQDSPLLTQAEQIIKQYFVGRASVTDQQLLYGALKGMLQSLGDTGHSVFLTPDEYAAYQASLNATVAGIGVVMSSNNGVFSVTRVIASSPAAGVGMKPGDQITAVDGTSTEGMTLDQLGSLVRGTAGTSVKVTIVRSGAAAPITFDITRAQVTVPLVGWGMVPGTHIADISLAEFATGASDQLASAIGSATSAGATSIILDLRGNPGGYASEATDVASEFLSSGVVYIEQDASGKKSSITVDGKVAHNDLPLVVLVDHDSASSSEIVAGALQDSGRAKIVGIATFGTGTVLQKFSLSDGSVIFLGTSDWLTPAGHKIFGVGITPDQVVALPVGTVPVDPTALDSTSTTQLNASGDSQLLAAVADLSK